MPRIDIYNYGNGYFSVSIERTRQEAKVPWLVGASQHDEVTRSSLARAQRMQLALYDKAKAEEVSG